MTKRILTLLLVVIGLSFTVPALAQKFGHINSTELLSEMPGVQEAKVKLQEYAQQLDRQNQTMMNEYQQKVQEYQGQEKLMADAVREVKLKEITDLEMRIQTFQQSAQEKLANKQEELYAPIQQKVENAIEKVAKEQGYAYVFDTSMGSVLYAQESDDIMALVKKELGIN